MKYKNCYLCEIYDAKYGRFGKWLEPKCSNENCEYCGKRPKRHPRKCKCNKMKAGYWK